MCLVFVISFFTRGALVLNSNRLMKKCQHIQFDCLLSDWILMSIYICITATKFQRGNHWPPYQSSCSFLVASDPRTKLYPSQWPCNNLLFIYCLLLQVVSSCSLHSLPVHVSIYAGFTSSPVTLSSLVHEPLTYWRQSCLLFINNWNWNAFSQQ